jgi:hypothetical protein
MEAPAAEAEGCRGRDWLLQPGIPLPSPMKQESTLTVGLTLSRCRDTESLVAVTQGSPARSSQVP